MTRSRWTCILVLSLPVLLSVATLFFSPLREMTEPRQLFEALGQIREHPAAPLLFLAGFVSLAILGSPLIPLVIAGAAVFGFASGFTLNYIGVLLSSSGSYWLARALGRSTLRHLLGSRYLRVESLVERQGFWPMTRLRFLPIPFPLANYGVAVLGVRYTLFLSSTAVAYVPILSIYSYFASTLVSVGEAEREGILRRLALSIVLLLLLTFLPRLIGTWRRSRSSRLDSDRGVAGSR